MEKQKLRLGTVAFSPKGKWNAETEYKRLNVVHYLASSYYAKKDNVGQTPSLDSEYWGLLVEGGDVVNNPDEEDITTEVVNEEHVLKLADRDYRPDQFSGKGYKILRKNLKRINLAVTKITVNTIPTADGEISITINNVDTHVTIAKDTQNTTTLVATAISEALIPEHEDYDVEVADNVVTLTRKHSGEVETSAFDVTTTGMTLDIEDSVKTVTRNLITPVMVNQPNTIYEIRYDFDLDGQTIEVPENCTLKFDGGCLRNGTVILNYTYLCGYVSLPNTVQGTVSNAIINPIWFGADKNGEIDSTIAIQTSINFLLDTSKRKTIYLENGTYNISSPLIFTSRMRGVFCGQTSSNTIIMAKKNMPYMISTDVLDRKEFIQVEFHTFALNGNRNGVYYNDKTTKFNDESISLAKSGIYFPCGYIYTKMFDIKFTNIDGFALNIKECYVVCFHDLFIQFCKDGIALTGNVNGVQILYSEFNTIKRFGIVMQSSFNVEISNNVFEVINNIGILGELSNINIQNNYFETVGIEKTKFYDYDNNKFLLSCNILVNGINTPSHYISDFDYYFIARSFPSNNVSISNNTFQPKDDLDTLLLVTAMSSGKITDNSSYKNIALMKIELLSNSFKIHDVEISRNINMSTKELLKKVDLINYSSSIKDRNVIYNIQSNDISNGINSFDLANHLICATSQSETTQTDEYYNGCMVFDTNDKDIVFIGQIKDSYNHYFLNIDDLNCKIFELSFFSKEKGSEKWNRLFYNLHIKNYNLFNAPIPNGLFTLPTIKVIGENCIESHEDKLILCNHFDGSWGKVSFKKGTKIHLLNDPYVDYRMVMDNNNIINKYTNIIYGNLDDVMNSIVDTIASYQGMMVYDTRYKVLYINNGKSFVPVNRLSGTTEEIPSLRVIDAGLEYYDSSLKKKILWNGNSWTNLDGTSLP